MTTNIAPYVSNTDRPVFAIANLPEEVIAVLFAQYSRSPFDLRTNLRKLLTDEGETMGTHEGPVFAIAAEKARAFHNKWVVGYGHASVAEHATIHLGVEGVSILAAKAIEDARLASFTEKSTRYVAFTRGSYVTPPELVGASCEGIYRASCEQLFDTYLTLLPQVTEDIANQAAGKVGDMAIKARALDTLRGLLPASTMTNVGITANARTVANLVTKLRSSPLGEMRKTGEALRVEGENVCPTLLRHAEPSAFRAGLTKVVLEGVPEVRDECHWEFAKLAVRSTDTSALRTLVHHLLATICGGSAVTPVLGYERLIQIVRSVMAERGPHESAPRAFESVVYQIGASIDYGAFRDLQRHRICSLFNVPLCPRRGFERPPFLSKDQTAIYEAAMRKAADTWEDITFEKGPLVGQYAVPLGFRVAASWVMNLREVIHVIELRSAKQGHVSYRRFAQDLYEEIIKTHPWLEGLIRVDMNDYPFAREEAK